MRSPARSRARSELGQDGRAHFENRNFVRVLMIVVVIVAVVVRDHDHVDEVAVPEVGAV
jgi:hypothetical protein